MDNPQDGTPKQFGRRVRSDDQPSPLRKTLFEYLKRVGNILWSSKPVPKGKGFRSGRAKPVRPGK
jgi:hypothetical protein